MTATATAVLLGLTTWWAVAAPAQAGTIKGMTRFTGAPVEAKTVRVTVDHTVCGTEKRAEDLLLSPEKGIRNAVVSLQSPSLDAPRSLPPPPQVDQKQCVFVPRVVVVAAGGTVEFLNTDRLLHNLHSASTHNPVFNRTQPRGRTIPIVFRRPEIVRIDCDLHPWMRAWVVVAEHPFFVVTDDHGAFVLDGVPPGRYVLQLWHETLGTARRDVTVTDGATAVTIELPARP
jgi:hypothetical protein